MRMQWGKMDLAEAVAVVVALCYIFAYSVLPDAIRHYYITHVAVSVLLGISCGWAFKIGRAWLRETPLAAFLVSIPATALWEYAMMDKGRAGAGFSALRLACGLLCSAWFLLASQQVESSRLKRAAWALSCVLLQVVASKLLTFRGVPHTVNHLLLFTTVLCGYLFAVRYVRMFTGQFFVIAAAGCISYFVKEMGDVYALTHNTEKALRYLVGTVGHTPVAADVTYQKLFDYKGFGVPVVFWLLVIIIAVACACFGARKSSEVR